MQRGLLSLVLVLCAFGCTGVVLQPAPEYELAASELAGLEATYGDAPRCWDELDTMRWIRLPQAELQRQCGVAPGEELEGCMFWPGDSFKNPATIAVEDIERTPAELLQLQRHELTHWFLACSGIDLTTDPDHTRPIWRGRY